MNRDQRRNSEGYIDLTAYGAIKQKLRDEHCKLYRPLVYICSPFSGDVERNINNARRYCAFAVKEKYIPLASHLIYPQFMDHRDPVQRELALFFGIILLGKCEALWVFGSYISEGMKAEIAKAKQRCIPIRFFSEKCEEMQTIWDFRKN